MFLTVPPTICFLFSKISFLFVWSGITIGAFLLPIAQTSSSDFLGAEPIQKLI